MITLPQLNESNALVGVCFYDESQSPLEGVDKATESPVGMYPYMLRIPDGAAYARTTKRTDNGFAPFSCIGYY